MKKQEIKELTYAQKIALDGEISYAIATSNHDDEVLYRMYSILLTIPRDLYRHVLESFVRLSNIPEEKIQRVRAEIALGKVPLWIWENKCISDLKECIKYSGQALNQSSITANQKLLRINLVKSALIFFIRKIAMLAAKPAYNLCLKILDEPELEQLQEICTFLLHDLSELDLTDKINKSTLMQVIESNFDLRETLSLKLEIKAMEMMDRSEKSDKPDKPPVNDEILNAILGKVRGTKETTKSIEDLINTAFSSDEEEPTAYVVKKIFNGSGKSATLETFNSKKEAEEFIKDILTNMPELSQTCTFVIEHQIK